MVKLEIAPKHGKIGDPMVITVFENNIPVQAVELSVAEGSVGKDGPTHHIRVTRIEPPRVPLRVVSNGPL